MTAWTCKSLELHCYMYVPPVTLCVIYAPHWKSFVPATAAAGPLGDIDLLFLQILYEELLQIRRRMPILSRPKHPPIKAETRPQK
jgi:hypothetical protein